MSRRTPTERALLIAVVGLAVLVALAISTQQAGSLAVGRAVQAEAHMLALVNQERAEHGLAPLTARGDLAQVAYAWSVQMAHDDVLAHNPTHPDEICCWQAVAENVAFSDPPRLWQPGDGVTRVTEELHQALLDSPPHRANLLDPGLAEIGIGIEVTRSGRVWITQNFRTPVASTADR